MWEARRAPAALLVGVAALLVSTAAWAALVLLRDPAGFPMPRWIVAVQADLEGVELAGSVLIAYGAWCLARRGRGGERAFAIAATIASTLLVVNVPVRAVVMHYVTPDGMVAALKLEGRIVYGVHLIARFGLIAAVWRRVPRAPITVALVMSSVLMLLFLPGLDLWQRASDTFGAHAAVCMDVIPSLVELGALALALLHYRADASSFDGARGARGLRRVSVARYARPVIALLSLVAMIAVVDRRWSLVETLTFGEPLVAALIGLVAVAGVLAASDAHLDARAAGWLAIAAGALIGVVAFEAFALEGALAHHALWDEIYADVLLWSLPVWQGAAMLALAAAVEQLAHATGAASPGAWPPAIALAVIELLSTAWMAHVFDADQISASAAAVVALVLDVAFAVASIMMARAIRRVASHLGEMPSLPTAIARIFG